MDILLISIHALREEGDQWMRDPYTLLVFLSTPSARRATIEDLIEPEAVEHFYPRPPRGGRPAASGLYKTTVDISIHALREEGDFCFLPLTITYTQFLSTPSARRATRMALPGLQSSGISIHALREEGDLPAVPAVQAGVISIHALREEGDVYHRDHEDRHREFLSTPSARRATLSSIVKLPPHIISIHALREEGDPVCSSMDGKSGLFLSTPSARRATALSSL